LIVLVFVRGQPFVFARFGKWPLVRTDRQTDTQKYKCYIRQCLLGGYKNKTAELTPGLARDRAATWRLILNLDSSAAIEGITCAANWRKR